MICGQEELVMLSCDCEGAGKLYSRFRKTCSQRGLCRSRQIRKSLAKTGVSLLQRASREAYSLSLGKAMNGSWSFWAEGEIEVYFGRCGCGGRERRCGVKFGPAG